MAAQTANHQAAVVASPSEIATHTVTQPFRLNNVALTWIRDTHEDPPGFPTVDRVELTHLDPYMIGVIEKTVGMDYSFTEGQLQPWSWRQMLAAFSPSVRELILGQPAQGVTRVTCEHIPNSNDHKRCHAANELGKPFPADAPTPVWDFVVTRTDGIRVRFHTSYKGTSVEVAELIVGTKMPPPPRRGAGNSD